MIRIRTVFTGVAGTPWYSNLFFDGTGSTDAQDACDAVYDLFAHISTSIAVGIHMNIDAFVPSIDPVSGDVTGGYTVVPTGTIEGSNIALMLPPANQVLVDFQTGVYVAGRQISGKFFMPGVTAPNSTGGGQVNPVLRADVLDAFNDLLAVGPDLVVWSRKNGQTAPVQSVIVKPEFAVLRSRRD